MGKANQKLKALNWQTVGVDGWLAFAFVFLLLVGAIMVASSSVAVAEKHTGDAFYYLKRHIVFISLGLFFSFVMMQVPSEWMDRLSRPILILAIIALILVLVPGVGVKVNGAQRWLNFGIARFQVVEAVKLALIAALTMVFTELPDAIGIVSYPVSVLCCEQLRITRKQGYEQRSRKSANCTEI